MLFPRSRWASTTEVYSLVGRKRKKASAKIQPQAHPSVRRNQDPGGSDSERIAWALGILDKDGPWGTDLISQKAWWNQVFPFLRDLETMTWSELRRAAGGRKRGNNHHPVSVEKMTRQAKKRLSEIEKDDISELFSLRLNSTTRIYGIRDGRVLKLLWYDPFHGNNGKAVYPVHNK